MCVCVWTVTSAPLSQGQLVFAAAALHTITINDVGPVWCLLVNHLLIIALRALSLPLPPSLSPRFLFPLHLLLYLSGHAPSPAEWESAGRPARQHFILRVTVGVGATVFGKMKVVCVCVRERERGNRDGCLDFLKSSCQCDFPLWESRGLHHVVGERRGRVQSLCHPCFVWPAEALHHPACHPVPPPQGERGGRRRLHRQTGSLSNRFISEIEIWVLSLTHMYACADCCSHYKPCFIPCCHHVDAGVQNPHSRSQTRSVDCGIILLYLFQAQPVSCWAFIFSIESS